VKTELDPFSDDDRSDEALDRLLAQAHWEEPSAAATQRLQWQWRGISRRRIYTRIGQVIAAAAGLALVIGSSVFWLRNHTEPQVKPPLFLSVVPDPDVSRRVSAPQIPKSAPLVGQPLTIDQKLALLSSSPQTAKPPSPAKAAAPRGAPAVADLPHLLAEARNPSADRRRAAMRGMLARTDSASMNAFLACLRDLSTHDDAVAVLRAAPNPPVNSLVAQLNSPLLANRMTAARALGEICDADVAEKLVQMVQTGTNRREAIAALLSSSKPIAARSLAVASNGNRAVHAQIQAMKLEISEIQ
jgi:hypothetical protein